MGKRFQCAEIYHAINILSKLEALFARQLNECLIERRHNFGKTTEVFVDSRFSMASQAAAATRSMKKIKMEPAERLNNFR